MNDNQLLYRASKYDCDGCALKPRCCPKEPARKVPRSTLEGARDMARDIAKTDAYSTCAMPCRSQAPTYFDSIG